MTHSDYVKGKFYGKLEEKFSEDFGMPVSRENLSELTTLMFSAALDPSRWIDFLDRLRCISGGVRTHLFGHDRETEHSLGLLASGYEDSFVESYNAYYGTMNAWAPSFSRHPTGTILPSEHMCPTDHLTKTEFYHDWIKPQEDILGGGGSVLFNENKRSFLFGGNIRRRDVDRLYDDWMELVALLTPNLQFAFEINRALAGKSVERLALVGETTTRTAVVVINAHRVILYANQSALGLLQDGAVVREDSRHRLDFADSTPARLFARAVHSIGRSDLFFTSEFRATDACQRNAYTCRTARMKSDRYGDLRYALMVGRDEPSLVLTLTPEVPKRDIERLLTERFSMTPNEAKVAARLSRGSTIAQIAEERAVSVHTVRNQLKSAMAKLGVHRQADLVREVLRPYGRTG